MKNKGRRHKSGHGPFANGDCKGCLAGITRPIKSMSSRPSSKKDVPKGVKIMFHSKAGEGKWLKRKWQKRVRGYFKLQSKEIL